MLIYIIVFDFIMCFTGDVQMQIADRRFGRTHLAIYGPKWAVKRRKAEKFVYAVAE